MALNVLRGNHLWTFILVAAMALSLSAPAMAQSQGAGQIVGTVFDSTGAAVPGAKVVVRNRDTGLTRDMRTNDSGQYRAVLLPPGPYSVTVEHPGFKVHKVDVDVTVGSTLTVDANLAIGMATETIEVTASVVVESTAVQNDALINLRSIANLPINGRRFHDFITLTPTVQIEPQRNGISFAGQRGINSNITLDGGDYNEPFFGGIRGGERSNNAFSIPQEAIAEFQVVPYGYSAEFGRSTAGVVNAVTKSGTNEWHGSGFYYGRDKSLGAKDAFNRTAITQQHQYGGSVGGPILRDSTFLFGSYEQQINDNPRQVVFRRLQETGVSRTTGNAEAFDFYKSIETPFTQTNDAWTALGKLDQQFGASHRVSVRYHWSKNSALNAVATGDQIFPETNRALSSNGTEGNNTHNVGTQWTAFFSPRVVNELRGVWSREGRPRLANAQQGAISNTIGDTGTRSFLPTTLTDWRVQVANNLTWNTGTHSLKFGGEFNHLYVNQFFKFNQFGFFSISGSSVMTVLDIMALDPANANDRRFHNTAVTYRVNIGNGELEAEMQELAFFVQDSWRVTPRFTVTAGFRWEGYFNPTPDTSNSALTGAVKNFPFALGQVDPGFIPDNFRQYMPRLGFAWDPWGNSKTVIRANSGLYYARTPMLLFAAPMNNFRTPAGDLSVQLPLALPSGFVCTAMFTGDTCNTVYSQLFRIGVDLNTFNFTNLPQLTFAQIQSIATALGLPFNPNQGLAPITWANNYESPRSFQWGVGFDREIGRGWSFGADYVNINTVHLQRNRDWNLPTPSVFAGATGSTTVGATTVTVTFPPDASGLMCYGLRAGSVCAPTASVNIGGTVRTVAAPTRSRPIPSLNAMQVRESNGRSVYNGLTFRTVYRRTKYQFQTYYTLSRSRSDDDNERSAGGQDAMNAFNLGPEYNYSRLDARHQFQFNGIIDLPWDFTVSGLMRARSARPLDARTTSFAGGGSFVCSGTCPPTAGAPTVTVTFPSFSTDTNGDFSGIDRPSMAPGVIYLRNAFRDLAIYNVDLRVTKRFRLPGERMRIDLTADFFNLFNFDNIQLGSTAGQFGIGISPINGSLVLPPSTFRQVFDPARCIAADPVNGNNRCYDTRNNPGSPFQVQFGVRFEF